MILGFLVFAMSLLNLEERPQNIVVETKQVQIPEYPDAFNASIIRWQGKLLMSFRDIPDRKSAFTSTIGLVWVDEEFCPISKPQLLQLRDRNSVSPCRAADARLVAVANRLYIVYDDNTEPAITRGGFRVHYGELKWNGKAFSLHNCDRIEHFEGESKNIREKSWVPFDYRGNLFLAYSITPHKIFYPLQGTGACQTIAVAENQMAWEWGDSIRGGTPALLEGDEYLAFFHTCKQMVTLHSKGKRALHYFIGAYTFKRDAPFSITKMTPEPIIGPNFYEGVSYKPYWGPIKAVFPCGFLADQNFVWIAYGRDDHEIWIAKLDKKALLDSLVEVK